MKLLARLEKSKEFWFLLISGCFFFILRFPSLFEPYWYGDEGIYQVLGMGIRAGRLLYRDIWDNKPPLLYLLYALFGSNQFLIRFFSLLVGIACVVVFYHLSKLLLVGKRENYQKQRKILYGLTIAFVILFGTPFIEGNIANAENFMMLPILLGAYLTLYYLKKPKNQTLLIIGVLLSVAFLLKVVALFDFAAFCVFLFIATFTSIKNSWLQIRAFAPMVVSFLVPIFLVVLFFVFNHAFSDFFTAAFKQNVGYVGYGNSFIIAQGLLFLKLVLLGSFIFFLLINRKLFSTPTLFIYIWFAFCLFNAFFSQRPYTHYVLVLLPSALLFAGHILFKIAAKNLFSSKVTQIEVVSGVILLLLVLISFHFYGKTIPYYFNFLGFITNTKSIDDYRTFFDGNTPNDYAIADYIKSHAKPNEGIFIWGDNAQVYTLTRKLPPGKYTVAYHITSTKDGLADTQKNIGLKKPRFFIVTDVRSTVPLSLLHYLERISFNHTLIYERAY